VLFPFCFAGCLLVPLSEFECLTVFVNAVHFALK
jgi:hypothetical protein